MLPNWLYGKSKSKLQEILGGGGGTPADYNQVKAKVNQNTEDIALLNDTLDEKAALTQISNPNLLDNPWFTVNQRGQSSYTATGYTVDRWKIQTTDITASISEDALTLSNTGSGYRNFIQNHEANFWSFLDGKKLTLSLMLSNGTILSQSQIVDFSQNASYCKISYTDVNNKEALCSVRSLGTATMIQFALEAGASITIHAIKLELGSVSTLAMDTAPNYATELLKCQRYFYKTLQFDDNGANISPNQCLAVSTTRLQGIKFPAEMRTNPTVTINKVNELGSSTAITGVTSQWTSKEGISYFTIADATVGNLYIVDFEASADL